MATPSLMNYGSYAVARWTGETGTGGGANMAEWPDKTVQRLGGTGTVTVEGSMDGTNWIPLSDQAGVAISLATATNEANVILENTMMIRVVNTGGTATVVILGNRG